MYEDYSIHIISSSGVAYVNSRDSEYTYGDLAIGLQNVDVEFIEPHSGITPVHIKETAKQFLENK